MLRALMLVISLSVIIDGYGQEEKNLSSLCLSVILPTNVEGLTESHLSKLESRITAAMANNGLSADDYSQNFVIYPKFEIYNEKRSQGGMRNITILDCNVSLYIKQLSTNIIFASYSKSIEGSGYNKNEAINDALQAIDPSDEKVAEFVKKGKEKILAYYQSNCTVILKKAEAEKNLKKYESALTVLLTVPAEATNCYANAQAKAIVIFAEYQKNNCSRHLQEAKAYVAAQNYDDALFHLSGIDPSGPCASESKSLIASISSKVDQQKKKEWDLLLKIYSDEKELKKARIQAMNNLAIAWVKNETTSPTYLTVIK